MKYSQNNEQQIIADYFGGYVGRFADIGANDGISLSNTYALALAGWWGLWIEPGPQAFRRLEANVRDLNGQPVPVAISDSYGMLTLLESDAHHGDNIGLLSTTNPAEVARWKGTQKFTPVEVLGVPWEHVKEELGITEPFDLFSIDVEGSDLAVLGQIAKAGDLVRAKMVVIEYNGNKAAGAEMTAICQASGLGLHTKTPENLIFAR